MHLLLLSYFLTGWFKFSITYFIIMNNVSSFLATRKNIYCAPNFAKISTENENLNNLLYLKIKINNYKDTRT